MIIYPSTIPFWSSSSMAPAATTTSYSVPASEQAHVVESGSTAIFLLKRHLPTGVQDVQIHYSGPPDGKLIVVEAPHGMDPIAQGPPLLGDSDMSLGPAVFATPVERKVLFSEDLVVRTKELKRWQPQIFVDQRTLEEDDD